MEKDRKKIISMRISEMDHAKIKRIASRMKVNDSDVFRFAIKVVLHKLTPLHDTRKNGKDVLPAFIEIGKELTHFFELDADRLDSIINDGVMIKEGLIERRDIELLAMTAGHDHYLLSKLREHFQSELSTSDPLYQLREYLYGKYLNHTEE
ncbi:MAG: hypothetical protein HY080_02975 [Gammaproteobacteria bacterium]|nr:hypothetical protein [Gammaproteobacteria bacterium]